MVPLCLGPNVGSINQACVDGQAVPCVGRMVRVSRLYGHVATLLISIAAASDKDRFRGISVFKILVVEPLVRRMGLV